MSSSRVVGFDFQNNHRVRRRRRRKGRGTPAGAKVTATSRRGGRIAARCIGGLTAIRSASTKATACPAAFSISIMNLVAHRPATDESNETLAACGAPEGRRGGVAPLASRADVERSHGESDVRHDVFGLENNLSLSCHQRSLRRRRRGTPMRDRLRNL